MSFPKKGKIFPGQRGAGRPDAEAETFTGMVSTVLRRSGRGRPYSVKLVARWTGARERTVKNWFNGSCAPGGEHFAALVRNCPDMLDAFLMATGHGDRIAYGKVADVEAALRDALNALAVLRH